MKGKEMSNALQKTQGSEIQLLFQKHKDQIAAALPRHITPDRMIRVALTELRKNPELMACDKLSFFGAIVQASQLGLEPGNALGHAYLVPFNNRKLGIKECNLIPGYRGLIELARRSGKIKNISARVVYEKDHFNFTYGSEEKLEHRPTTDADPGQIVFAYAVANLTDGGFQMEVMTRAQLDEHKRRFSHGNPVWNSDFSEMARKTVVRRLCKYLPTSIEMVRALAIDDEASNGIGQGNWGIIDSDYQPVGNQRDSSLPGKLSAQDSSEREIESARQELQNVIVTLKIGPDDIKKVTGATLPELLKGNAAQIYAAIDMLSARE